MYEQEEPLTGVIVAGHTAARFIRRYGEGAQFEIARHAFRCRHDGDDAQSEAWVAVLLEVKELQRTVRRTGERLN